MPLNYHFKQNWTIFRLPLMQMFFLFWLFKEIAIKTEEIEVFRKTWGEIQGSLSGRRNVIRL